MIAIGGVVSERTSVAAATEASGFDARFELLRPRLTAVAIGLVGRPNAEDVVQDAYLRARTRLGQLHDRGAIDAWLTRIVVRTAFNHRRRERGFLERLPLIGRRSAAASSDVGLRDLIERLPLRERTVLVLHYAHGYQLHEVGELLGISHANARQIAARARRRLAADWGPDE